MSKTLTSAEICFCFRGELIFKLPVSILRKHLPEEKKKQNEIYGWLYDVPDWLNEAQKYSIIKELKKDVSWSIIAPFISVSPDSRFHIEELWNYKEDRLGDYTIEIGYTEIPEKIFRYMPFNNEYLRNLINDEKIYLSSPAKFRDPFDCSLDESTFNIFKDKGICCFSAINDNILMYSHYAEGHSGLCICFDSDKLKESMKIPDGTEARISPVYYFNVMPPLDLNTEPVMCATCKDDVWSYEKEYRLFMHKGRALQSAGLYNFESKSITAIYFGCKASVECIETVKAMTKFLTDDSYFLARREPNKFGVTYYPV